MALHLSVQADDLRLQIFNLDLKSFPRSKSLQKLLVVERKRTWKDLQISTQRRLSCFRTFARIASKLVIKWAEQRSSTESLSIVERYN